VGSKVTDYGPIDEGSIPVSDNRNFSARSLTLGSTQAPVLWGPGVKCGP
jgi:hypothetical protein